MNVKHAGPVAVLIALCIVIPHATGRAESNPGSFDAREVEPGQLDAQLAGQGWVLLTKRGVRPSEFAQIAPETIQVSTDSSNGLIFRELSAPRESEPKTLTWEWRVDFVSERKVSGKDPDWPIVVYAAFDVDKRYLGWWRRWLNKLTFSFAGLPDSGKILTYVWSMDDPAGASYPNPYIPGIAYLKVLQSGQAGSGDWVLERRNLMADFETAFGHPAERLAFMAISADSEDTRSTSEAIIRQLRLE